MTDLKQMHPYTVCTCPECLTKIFHQRKNDLAASSKKKGIPVDVFLFYRPYCATRNKDATN